MEENLKTEGNGLKVILFTSPTCPHCPAAKEFIGKFSKKRTDFELFNFEAGDPETAKYAEAFQVRSVPTFIIQGPGTEENIGLVGIQTEETMNKYLDIAAGTKKGTADKKKGDGFKIGKFRIKF